MFIYDSLFTIPLYFHFIHLALLLSCHIPAPCSLFQNLSWIPYTLTFHSNTKRLFDFFLIYHPVTSNQPMLLTLSSFITSFYFCHRETQLLYDELSEIFSDDLNSKASRDILMQVWWQMKQSHFSSSYNQQLRFREVYIDVLYRIAKHVRLCKQSDGDVFKIPCQFDR